LPVAQAAVPPGVVDLGVGQPDPDLLPVALMRQAARHCAERIQNEDLAYGVEAGPGPFRQRLAALLSSSYGQPVAPASLMATAGASQALDLTCATFTRPGDVVLVEDPTYFLALRVLADRHLTIVGIPTDDAGIEPDAVAAAAEKYRPAMLYVIPTFHNPATTTLSMERRRALVALSERFGFVIVADEVYHLLAFDQAPPTNMAALDRRGTVLSLGSFSKILAPGLRLGWVQAAPERIDRLCRQGLLVSGGGINPYTAAVVRSVLDLDLLPGYLGNLKSVYHRRQRHLVDALSASLAPTVTIGHSPGGFFVWLTLPATIDAGRLHAEAKSRWKVGFQPGQRFSSAGAQRNCLRLSFAFYPRRQLTAGVDRLASALPADCRRQATP
jgi:2-aminoadipate transaminase